VKRALIELAEHEQVRPEGRCTAQELLEMNNWFVADDHTYKGQDQPR